MKLAGFFLVFLIVLLVVTSYPFVVKVEAPDYLTFQAVGSAYRFRTRAEDYVYVGDPSAGAFKPLITLYRWGTECSFSLGFDDSKIAVKTDSLASNTLSWTTPLFDFRYYPLDQNEFGMLEYEIVLKQKPPVNSWTFSVSMKNLAAYYQAPLTEKEIADGSYRPDNVIGSYAFYHVSKRDNEYVTGKAFHLYRPELIDAKGQRAWADLNMTDKTLTITLPQAFLGSAIYPVTVDPAFGYTSAGASYSSFATNTLAGSLFTAPSDVETASSFTFYAATGGSGSYGKSVLVTHSDLTIVSNGVGDLSSLFYSAGWVTSSFSASPSLTSSTDYVLMMVNAGGVYFYGDSGDTNQGHIDTSNSWSSPTDPTDANHNNIKYSIYCNYTVAAGSGNSVTLESPSDNAEITNNSFSFAYSPLFYDGTIQNSSLWLNVSGSWQRIQWNSSQVINNTQNSMIYTFAESGVYVWNVGVYNSTDEIFADSNRTVTVSTLIDSLAALLNRINFNDTIETRLYGYSFSNQTLTQVQAAIDASTDWKQVLAYYAYGQKYGLENQTKIEWALDNATIMANGLPLITDAFYVGYRYALRGYYFAELYSYELDKWNKTLAYASFKTAVDDTGTPVYSVASDNSTTSSNRFYDECAQTISCYLEFYKLEIDDGLTQASKWWEYTDTNYWNTNHYNYTVSSSDWECEAGGFIEIIAELYYYNTSVSNVDHLVTDAENRWLANVWASPQWNGYYTAIHAYPSNTQRRTINTLMSWVTLQALHQNLTSARKTNMTSMLNGYGGYSPAWKLLFNSTAALYNTSTSLFKAYSDSAAADNLSSAIAALNLLYMAIVPDTGQLAITLEERSYQGALNYQDGDLLNINVTSRTVTLGIKVAGDINFIFTSPVTQNFTSSGIYSVVFNSTWNGITSCTKTDSLPTNRLYFVLAPQITATAYTLDLSWSNTYSWTLLPQSNFINTLSWSNTHSWTMLPQTNFNIATTWTNTWSWIMDVQHTVGGAPTNYVVDLTWTVAQAWSMLIQSSFQNTFSWPTINSWTLLPGGSSFHVTTPWTNSYSWDLTVHIGVKYVIDLAWSNTVSWLMGVTRTPYTPLPDVPAGPGSYYTVWFICTEGQVKRLSNVRIDIYDSITHEYKGTIFSDENGAVQANLHPGDYEYTATWANQKVTGFFYHSYDKTTEYVDFPALAWWQKLNMGRVGAAVIVVAIAVFSIYEIRARMFKEKANKPKKPHIKTPKVP
jgi:hypothetical protein